ncbi:D-serine deaminase-like pyridoxal phosphate-dependent protein [Catalinimonas alkaloidigena]|uniref:D-TA family PLP-dependent enzyme n=1 Tax=Catalinimonas alkaloidigena TaxID=1075417 RepID=UPI0024051391|nr:D-TA family PLP-dependent enzyme [Catalinimonas alkaloidigena]MDF9798948.1 D-serine deaminase-like pyridoxal phosphate-dependent protein [Catalinimonas alkaloidigena]
MSKSNTEDKWYIIDEIEKVDSPTLVIYPERVKSNIRLLKSMIDDSLRLRPHIKTHKTREVSRLLMEEGIQKFKCATIAEAEMLGSCHAPDVLLAYQPVGPKLERFIKLVQYYPDTLFSCLCDHPEAARHMSELAESHELVIPIYIDLNVGMNRTGISSEKEAFELSELCSHLPGLQFMGFHVYDGHLSITDLNLRTKACNEGYSMVESLVETLIEKGYPKPGIVAGGSLSFPIHAQRKDVECSPGTFVYWDKGYQDLLPEQPFLPAAVLLSRVVSLLDEQKFCLDLGYKAIAAENPLDHRVYFLNAPELKVVSQSEEHLVVEADTKHGWKIGDVLYALPIHICPTCALYETVQVVSEGKVADEWEVVARKRSIHI